MAAQTVAAAGALGIKHIVVAEINIRRILAFYKSNL
jgi:hypothetical protein